MPSSESPEEPTFRRTSVDEAPAILRVLESAFDRWPAFTIDVSPLDHLRWKMTPPGDTAPLHAVVELNGEIVGVQLRWIGHIEVRGTELPFDFGTDMSVHESARGKRLGSLLRDSEGERLFDQRIVGFDTVSANQQVVDMYEERQPIRRPLARWTRPLTPRAFLATHRQQGVGRLTTATLRAAADRLRPRRRAPAGQQPAWRIEPVEAFDERTDALWSRVRGGYQLSRVRDAAWLNWRHLDPRAGQIEAFQAIEGDRSLGYAAFRRDGRAGRVLDLVTDPDAPGVGAALLQHGCARLREAGCDTVDGIVPSPHRDEAALQAAGFSRREAALAVQVTRARNRAVPEILEVFEDPTTPIHLMYGDFDHG